MIPVAKTIYNEILDEMFSSTIKTTNDFRLRSWKLRAKKLENVNDFHYKILNCVLLAYENKNEQGIVIAKDILETSKTIHEKAMALRCLGNMNAQLGQFIEAIDYYWEAFVITKDSAYFDSFLLTAGSYYYYDPRLDLMKALDSEKKERIVLEINKLKNEIDSFNSSNLSLEIYQHIIGSAFKVFFNHCSGKISRIPRISDSSITSILFNPELNSEIVGILNDEMADALVEMLDKYDYLELLKYPVIFTSEDYSKTIVN